MLPLFFVVVVVFFLLQWIKPCSVAILWKRTEHKCTLVLFVLLYIVVLTFSSVASQTLQCDHSLPESY